MINKVLFILIISLGVGAIVLLVLLGSLLIALFSKFIYSIYLYLFTSYGQTRAIQERNSLIK